MASQQTKNGAVLGRKVISWQGWEQHFGKQAPNVDEVVNAAVERLQSEFGPVAEQVAALGKRLTELENQIGQVEKSYKLAGKTSSATAFFQHRPANGPASAFFNNGEKQ